MPNAAIPHGAGAFYGGAPIQNLFARELDALAPILAGIYGSCGLFVRAHAEAPRRLPSHLLGTMVELALKEDRLDGAVRCDPAHLPFAGASFKLLIVQHVFEQIAEPQACAAELARILAPEGVMLLLGFNPWGLWRPWLTLAERRGAPRMRLRSARVWRGMLADERIETLQVRFPGMLWPRDVAVPQAEREPVAKPSAWGRWGSTWLLLARKRRSTLTPLRVGVAQRELAMNPRLAPGAHRACA